MLVNSARKGPSDAYINVYFQLAVPVDQSRTLRKDEEPSVRGPVPLDVSTMSVNARVGPKDSYGE